MRSSPSAPSFSDTTRFLRPAPTAACCSINISGVRVRHASIVTTPNASANTWNTKRWPTQPNTEPWGEMDQANKTAKPTALVNRPKLSAVPYSPLSFPRIPDDTMLVEATVSAMLTCLFSRGKRGWATCRAAGELLNVERQRAHVCM